MVDEKDFAILDMRYKKIEDCDNDMKATNRDVVDLEKELVAIKQSTKVNNWLTTVIAAGILSLVIKIFLGG